MAWIESHQALGNHPKLLKLARLMSWSKPDTVGRLHLFWHWCLDYAPNGYLDKHGHEVIAEVFSVDSSECTRLMQALRESEFLDFEPQFRVHDWWDYAGRYLQVRYKNKPKLWKEIKRLYGHSVQRTKQPTKNPLTTDNATINQPNQPIPTNLNQPIPTKTSDDWFQDFWAVYPRKDAKQDAVKAWKKLQPSGDLAMAIIANVTARKGSPDWTKDNGQFIPLPATYLRKRRWEDQGIAKIITPDWKQSFLANNQEESA